MIYSILILAIVFYFYKKSKNNFFFQDREILAEKRHHLMNVIVDFKIPKDRESIIFEAYKYFCENPSRYDGTTIAKDLFTIKGLEVPSMVHDYEFIFNEWWTWKGFLNGFKLNLNYAKDLELFGVSSWTAYIRFILLCILIPIYCIKLIFKKLKK